MNSKMIIVGITVLSVIGLAQASDYERDEYKKCSMPSSAVSQAYVEECSSCHLAYPASMLPARSWQKMMGNLENHFDENAELDAEMNQQISDYLVANAGDSGSRSSKMLRSLSRNDTPLRISELPYFKKEHDEMPRRVLQDERIGSLSNCQNCHQKAEQGSFRERDINIPGYGRWED